MICLSQDQDFTSEGYLEGKLVHISKEHMITEAEEGYEENLPLKILYHVQCSMLELHWL